MVKKIQRKRTRRILMDSRPKGDRDNHRGIQTSRIPDKNYFE
jgi:hypothetical protein